MSPSIFLSAATRAKLSGRTRTPATTISLRDACCFIETFVNGNQRCYATHSAAAVPEHSSQPPSHRPFAARRTLLHRTYVSILRSTPLLILFQHNNLRSNELTALRRDLKNTLAAVDAQLAASQPSPAQIEDGEPAIESPKPIGEQIKMTILNKEVFSAALRVAEYLPSGSKVSSSTGPEAYDQTVEFKKKHDLSPLLVGPIGAIEFPAVSPAHLLAVLNLIFPERATFKKGTDPAFISGVQKILLLGAKVDKVGGSTIDNETLRYITTLGDLTTLRGQLLGVLQSASAGVVATLQGPSRAMWVMLEGRRKMLEPPSESSVGEETP